MYWSPLGESNPYPLITKQRYYLCTKRANGAQDETWTRKTQLLELICMPFHHMRIKWCSRWDLNPQNPEFKPGTYAILLQEHCKLAPSPWIEQRLRHSECPVRPLHQEGMNWWSPLGESNPCPLITKQWYYRYTKRAKTHQIMHYLSIRGMAGIWWNWWSHYSSRPPAYMLVRVFVEPDSRLRYHLRFI